jgi:predicted MPP superfamily phosphohydrolase
MVKAMKRRFALAMCEGNHDLFEGREEFERRVKRAGITLLVNESTTMTVRGQRVQLLGLRWGRPGTNGRVAGERGDDAIAASMEVLLKQRRDDSFPILLAHHPHAFDPAAAAGIPLTLSGHTHGGQIMLSKDVGFGPAMFRYWSGLYQRGNSALVVSNGVGNWFPLRVNAPAEIMHITLRATP